MCNSKVIFYIVLIITYLIALFYNKRVKFAKKIYKKRFEDFVNHRVRLFYYNYKIENAFSQWKVLHVSKGRRWYCSG